jgi:protein-S-isoprenylcysteine O-methyltransferase Ste14
MTLADLSPTEWLALQRMFFLAVPVFCACGLVLYCRPTPREATAAMVGFLWQLPALLLLNMVAAALGWWQFNAQTNMLAGVPIDVWIGWAIWWGPVAVFLNRWAPIWLLVALSVVIDLATMPFLKPLVALGEHWLLGDAVAMALCLAPGLYMAKLTREDVNPKRRAMFHVLGWGGYMVLVLPVATLAYTGRPLHDLYRMPSGLLDWVLLGLGVALLFVGIAATAEFAREGDGTPIPYDPPKTVVATGPYAFNANPMQIISAAFMARLAAYAGSWGLLFIAAMFLVFDGIYAAEYNRQHIARDVPAAWSSYRSEVEDWRVRWTPHLPTGSAKVIISPDGPAHAVWQRFWPLLKRYLAGQLEVIVADRSSFRRLVYLRPSAGIEDMGMRAAARILEHGPLPFAVIGWFLRFPYLGGALQRLSGLAVFLYRRYRGLA